MAAIVDYATLQTAVADWINRTDLTNEIKDFISIAEAKIYRRLRIPSMEVQTTLTTGVSTGKITIPADFLQLKGMMLIDGDNRVNLRRKPVDEVQNSTRTGIPKFYARLATEWVFEPTPDTTYNMRVYYYKQLDALSDVNNTNFFTQFAPDLLLYGALAEAFMFLMEEERAAVHAAKFERLLQETQDMADDAEWAESPLQVG